MDKKSRGFQKTVRGFDGLLWSIPSVGCGQTLRPYPATTSSRCFRDALKCVPVASWKKSCNKGALPCQGGLKKTLPCPPGSLPTGLSLSLCSSVFHPKRTYLSLTFLAGTSRNVLCKKRLAVAIISDSRILWARRCSNREFNGQWTCCWKAAWRSMRRPSGGPCENP